MNGFQLTFFTREGARYHHELMTDWLLGFAHEHGAYGGTVVSGTMGFDHAGVFHSAGFFELSDRPLAITVSVNEDQCEDMLQALDKENIALSYTKVPIEYGTLGSLKNA